MRWGGGTGLLGAFLHEAGYSYISTDVAQAYYLTQNNLWEALFPESVEEFLETVGDSDAACHEKILHIPYWKLWELRNRNMEADIMVANHCLTEMHQRSLRFYLAFGRQLMRNSQYKLFIAQGPGYFNTGNIRYLLESFDGMGYELIYSEKDFVIFRLKDSAQDSAIDIKRLLRKYKGGGCFPEYKKAKDKTAVMFDHANQKISKMKKVSLKEIEEFFSSLDSNVNSPDEEFITYCGLPRL